MNLQLSLKKKWFEMTKQEKIKEAYISLFYETPIEEIEKRYSVIEIWIDENGWFEGNLNNVPESQIDRSGHEVRPKSLDGIENNNGWIKIEDYKNLTAKNAICIVFTDKGNIYTYATYCSMFSICELETITHYKIIKNPKPPLY